jgi:voltage-gated potassium channel
MPESQDNLAEAAAATTPSAPDGWLGTLTKRWLAGAAGIALLFGLFALAQPINVAGNPLLLAGLCFFLFTSYWAVFAVALARLSRSQHPVVDGVILLLLMFALLLLGYAFLYHSLSFYDAEAFTTAIATKISAVYFSVTTLSTVGFGEISPGNDTARLVVMSQMILDLTLLGLGVKLLSQASKNRAQELASQSGDSDQPAPQS